MTSTINLRLKIIEELLRETPERKRCPYIRIDDTGPYCSKDLKGNEISETRRMVCDISSLQLWCLDIREATRCIYYQDEEPLD